MHQAPHSPAAPSRLLIVTDAVSGRWHYAVGLIRELSAHAPSICLAVVGPGPTAAQRAEVAMIGNTLIHDHPFALEWMPNPWSDIARAGEWLLELEEGFGPDVVHLTHYCYGALPWSAPVLVTAWGDRVSRARACGNPGDREDDSRYLSEMLAGLRAADLVVAPARATLDDLRQHSGAVPSDALPVRCEPRVIAPACCPLSYQPRPKREFVFAAGCAWDPAKNIEALEYASRELPWPVFLAGSTDHPDGNGPDCGAIDCLGPLASRDLANWMGLAPIFALPSRYEACGLAVREAALSGCALVLADLPVLREQWCQAALFVDPERPLELANALQKLIRRPEERRRLGQLARKRALTHTPRAMAESYLECYRDITARRGAGLAATTEW